MLDSAFSRFSLYVPLFLDLAKVMKILAVKISEIAKITAVVGTPFLFQEGKSIIKTRPLRWGKVNHQPLCGSATL